MQCEKYYNPQLRRGYWDQSPNGSGAPSTSTMAQSFAFLQLFQPIRLGTLRKLGGL
jgi:hypothetical protein